MNRMDIFFFYFSDFFALIFPFMLLKLCNLCTERIICNAMLL